MPETILAFDFGLRRIGIAVGQQVTRSANALGTVPCYDGKPSWPEIQLQIQDWQPDRLIVGLPLHADGSESEMTNHARKFADQLAQFELPIELVDERYSSVEAEAWLKEQRSGGLRGRISKEMVDAAAAVQIATRWLDRE